MGIKESILRQSDTIQAKKSRRERKDKGVFYTPPEVIERMAEKILEEADPVANPYIRVLDPACGTGLFLIKAFEVLKSKFERDYDLILDKNGELSGKLGRDDIGTFIVENNLWGADIDREALDTAREILIKLAGKECRPKLLCCDSLVSGNKAQISLFDDMAEEELEFWSCSFDYILGNPPYIGHKQVPLEYKEILQNLYKGIYRDKSDISYCFFKKGIDLLKEGGQLSFITSRYFMEGPSAEGLRKYIKDTCTITEVVDFYGSRVFRDAGVSACIVSLRKGSYGDETLVLKGRQGVNASGSALFEASNFECFTINSRSLKKEGWVLISPDYYEVYSIVEEKGGLSLSDAVDSYQGIITGCDRAFVVSRNEIEEQGIEEALLRPWIKNSNISKFGIKAADKYLIYSDFIINEEDFPNAIKHIRRWKEKLEERRECRKGIRKWYQLQWGRNNEIFQASKIVYPFKASSSRFAVDEGGSYCSADVYSLRLKELYEGKMTLEYIAAVLNSRLFEFYFKCYAKKISEDLYDYYPNTVLRMKIPDPDKAINIKRLSLQLENCKNEDAQKAVSYEIDRELYKLYGLNERQIRIVEGRIWVE